MTPDERNLITGLFERLRQADGAAGNKDAEALQLIQQQTAAVPVAPYLLVQTVLVQEHALTNAQARIADLERQVAAGARPSDQGQEQGGGSFLGNMLKKVTGTGPQPPPLPASAQAPGAAAPYGRQNPGQPGGGGYDSGQQQPPAAPYPTTNTMAPGGGGSFLKSALGTAAGVAGGAMLFQGIQNLMGHNAGPFAGGMSGLGGGQVAGGGQGFLGGGAGGVGGPTEVTNNYYGDNAGGGGGGSVGDFADRFGGASETGGGAAGGGTVGDFADAQGNGGGGFFDTGPEVQDAGYDEQGGGGGGTVGDYADDNSNDGGGDDGDGFFDDGGSDDSTV